MELPVVQEGVIHNPSLGAFQQERIGPDSWEELFFFFF